MRRIDQTLNSKSLRWGAKSTRARAAREHANRGQLPSGTVAPQKNHRESDLSCWIGGNTRVLFPSFWRGPAPPHLPPFIPEPPPPDNPIPAILLPVLLSHS